MLKSESIQRLLRFGLVGIAVMVFFMALNWLFGRVLPAQAAFFAAYPPALLLHFLLNKWWTFGDQRATSGRHVADYLYTVTITLLIQWPVFALSVHVFGWPAWLSAGVANLMQMTASFLLLYLRVFRADSEPGAAASWQRLVTLLAGLGMAVLLAWTALGKWEFPALGPDCDDHYNLLVHGFRKGSLAMDIPVPPDLKEIADPWNPANRPPGLWVPPDTSYFNGHFYLYFGVAPAVLLMWPFRAITGVDLPLAYALIIFCVSACWALGWLWLRVLRDHFPAAGWVTRLGGMVVLGLGGGLLMLARRAHFWELPIAAGQACLAVFAAACYLALHAKRPSAWLALAGLSLGFAVGSRPSLAVAGVGLACVVVAIAWRAHKAEGGWRALKKAAWAALAAGLPLVAVLAALLAYNYARFGQLTEFGLNYQLTSRHEMAAVHFSRSFARFNWEMYFWRSPQWERYFPFVRQAIPPTPPAGYYTCEYVFGALTLSPVLWLVLLLPGIRADLRAFCVTMIAMAGAITIVLLCFNTAVARYTADFLPWWLLLGLLGWASAEVWLQRWRAGQWIARTMAGGLMLVTVILAFCASAELHGVFRYRNPEMFLAIARMANRPAAWWEARHGQEWGPMEMDIVFPGNPPQVREPLLVAAAELRGQSLIVNYLRPGFLRLEFESPGSPGLRTSEEIAVEPGRTYHLRAEMGSLYPPEGHPLFSLWSPLESAWHAHWLRVELDGRPIFNEAEPQWEISPAAVLIGRDFREGREPRFNGVLKNVRRAGLPRRLTDTTGGGDLVFRLGFPRGKLPRHSPMIEPAPDQGRPQPIVTFGRPGNADLIALRLNGDGSTFTLCYESWGGGVFESPSFMLPANREGVFRVRLGSILDLPAGSPLMELHDTLVVWLDDRPIWWRRLAAPITGPALIAVAANPIGSNAATQLFRGRIDWWDRLPPPPAWQAGPFEELRVSLIGQGTGSEPLVATGVAGAANTLAIEWRAGGKARLIYDHWGYEARQSAEFDWPVDTENTLSIELPAFPQLDAAKTPPVQEGRLCVRLEGRVLWEQNVPFHVADANTVVVGKNVAGSSVAGPQLTSLILDLAQARRPVDTVTVPARPTPP
jgi:putative flippase GtrA